MDPGGSIYLNNPLAFGTEAGSLDMEGAETPVHMTRHQAYGTGPYQSMKRSEHGT